MILPRRTHWTIEQHAIYDVLNVCYQGRMEADKWFTQTAKRKGRR